MKKFIPNSITLLNLLCGSVAVVYAAGGCYYAVWMLCILASVFDFFDGFAARKLGAYSEIGKELDSLSDLVSFGLAPSVALLSFYKANVGGAPEVLAYTALIIVACSALRLAKFNLDERQTKSFLGLPTPACGLLVVSLAAFQPAILQTVWFIPVLSVVLSALLISEIPMFSMKQRSRRLKFFFAGIIFIGVICGCVPHCAPWWNRLPEIMAYAFIWYIIINLKPVKTNETH